MRMTSRTLDEHLDRIKDRGLASSQGYEERYEDDANVLHAADVEVLWRACLSLIGLISLLQL